MIIKAEQKYIRQSPRKVRLVVDAIRELTPKEALDQLAFMRKRAAMPVSKTIKQAIANAVKNMNIPEESLRFATIDVGEGPVFKRWNAVSRGRAHQILKRTSHIKVLLTYEEPKERKVQPMPKKDTKSAEKKRPIKRAERPTDKRKEG